MFRKEKKKKSTEYEVHYDNLAMPEVHTGQTLHHDSEQEEKHSIDYDTVAVPEIHIKK